MLRTGNICLSFLINYLKSNNTKEKLNTKNEKLKCLSDTFSQYGGILTKISQVLKYQDESDSEVFSSCKPFNPKKTLLLFKNEILNNPEKYSSVVNIDYSIYKSGSIGQVHMAELLDGKQIIFKVQYYGLEKQFHTDFLILDNIINYLFNNDELNLTDAVVEVKKKLIDELDYHIEIKNQQQQYSIWKDHSVIKIPLILPNLCSDKILCMEFVKGLTLNDFIKTALQENINKIGLEIVRFTFTNIYHHGLFYSDIHYGNFIIDDSDNKLKLFVTDFGCINNIDSDLKQKLILIHKFFLSKKDDKDEFYNLLMNSIIEKEDLNTDDENSTTKELLLEFFKLQYLPWTSEYFKFDTDSDWWKKTSSFNDASVIKKIKLPAKAIYLAKIPFGLFYIFGKMKVEGSFSSLFDELFLN